MIQLVDGWKKAYKWFSVNCMILAGSLQGTWAALPVELKASIPPNFVTGMTIAILVAGVIGRLIKQDVKNDQQSQT